MAEDQIPIQMNGGESYGLTFNGQWDIKTECKESPVKSEKTCKKLADFAPEVGLKYFFYYKLYLYYACKIFHGSVYSVNTIVLICFWVLLL